jgi:hypothetical protein
MPLNIVAEETLHVGQLLVVDGGSPAGRFVAVFEDDGETGYFYAIDSDIEDANPIQDALHVYDVASVSDAHLPCMLEIGWSDDGQKVLLLINDQPHAAFDFARRQGWCQTGEPSGASESGWSPGPRQWSEDVEALFD